MADESESLRLDWIALRPKVEGEIPHFTERDLLIRTSRDRVLAVLKPDGTVEFGPDYTPDEAAVTFWEAMGRRRLGYEDRMLVIEHIERLLVRLGRQDLRTEHFRLQELEEKHPARKQALHLTVQGEIRRLNMYMDQVIELARGLAQRPGETHDPVPEQVPSSIEQNEASNYRGREALPDEPDDERPTVPEAPQSRPSPVTTTERPVRVSDFEPELTNPPFPTMGDDDDDD